MAALTALHVLGECPVHAGGRQLASPAGAPGQAAPLEVVWAAELPAPPAAAAEADAERIFVPLTDGTVVALERETGGRTWSRAIASRWPPQLTADALFLTAADAIYELDPATGATRRRIDLAGEPSAPAAVEGDLLAVALEAGGLHAVDRHGRPVWDARPGSSMRVRPALGASAAYIALADGRIVALARGDGRQLWGRTIEGAATSLLHHGDRVFVGSTDDMLYAFDAASGDLAWSWRAGNDVIGMAAGETRVFVASLDNMIRALDLEGGNLGWQQVTGTRPAGPPFRVGNRLYVPGLGPPLMAFDAATGVPAGSFALPSPYAPLLLAGPLLVLPDDDSQPVHFAAVARTGTVVGLRSPPPPEDDVEDAEEPAGAEEGEDVQDAKAGPG